MKKRISDKTTAPAAYSHSPSERVREYLDRAGKNLKPGETLRIPPVRHLAKELQVSTATIYHIFKEMNAAGTISTTVGRGSFLKGKPSPSAERITVGLSWPSDGNQPLNRSYLVAHAIFQATLSMDVRIDLRPIPMAAFESDTEKEYIMRQANEVDALIYRSFMSEFEGIISSIEQTYEKANKPVIRLDSPSLCATRNFVAPDIYSVSSHAGRVWAQTGRRQIAFLMRESVNATVSTLYSLIGLKSGMAIGGAGDQRIIHIFCQSVTEEAAYDSMIRYLDHHKKAPDAIFCFGDIMAVGAIRALEEKGVTIPDEVSLIGATGFDDNHPAFSNLHGATLSRARFCYEDIARSLLTMVIERVNRKGEDVPGVFIPGTIFRGTTTRTIENEAFAQIAAD